ncbi:ABC transporter permease [Caldalkalibacillus mannanilyticus]|uniref:ABC transporter permease n=1 Tax=Caldalkalibacillus mannanilyticus TaxID=1418 RepID=UPI00046A2AD4|nr:ABC transporter permease [Caldalkalibacillus mannanilyticus]
MFNSLFMYEFEKFWSKKLNIVCFLAIPLIIFLSLTFSMKTNETAYETEVNYTTSLNFHILSLQEMLLTAFNAIVIILAIVGVHNEYRKGNLRMAFTRGISIKKLYLAKSLVFLINLFLLMLLQLILSFMIGYYTFPRVSSSPLFFKEGFYGIDEITLFTFKYYLLAYLSLLTFSSIVEYISIKCKTMTGVLGISVGFFFVNVFYIGLSNPFFKGYPEEHIYRLVYDSLSIIYIQAKGVAYFASGETSIFLYSLLIMFVLFKGLSFSAFANHDYLD